MKIYFLRHGVADWPDWTESDDERPLTKKGTKETRKVAKFLHKLDAFPSVILTSPLPRASQTAAIAGKVLRCHVVEEAGLSPGCNITKLRAMLKKHSSQELMVVGHEPDFSTLLAKLTGARLKIAKSGVALVEMDSEAAGKLLWLFPPQAAKA